MITKSSPNALLLITHYEGFRANPYMCPAGKPTIGYGTTVYPNGKKVRMGDAPVSKNVAMEILKHDLGRFETDINSLLKVPLSQHQYDALVSFAYNVGTDIDADLIAEGLGDSTLLKLINNGIIAKDKDWKKKITAEFEKWCKARKNGKLVVVRGLANRRKSEAHLFCEGIVKFYN